MTGLVDVDWKANPEGAMIEAFRILREITRAAGSGEFFSPGSRTLHTDHSDDLE